MKYLGQFTSLDNSTYSIHITSNKDASQTKQIVLGASPFITNVQGDDNIFKPVKYSSASIHIVSPDYLFDVYSSETTGTPVQLYNGETLCWTGYLTPNLYNQNCECYIEEVELEAVDGLSVLKSIDYTTDKKTFKSFTDIISFILNNSGCYKYFYLPYSYQYKKGESDNFFSKLNISEADFFDEDNKPMKCSEVLEEMCKFMGVTAVAYGDSVYFLDYGAIRNGINDYYKIPVGQSDPKNNRVTINDSKPITKDSYAENGSQVSLGQTYNKISVKDSLYSVTSILPELDDLTLLENKNGANNYEKTIYKYPNTDPAKDINIWSFNKFYSHPNYIERWYDKTTMSPVTNFTPTKYSDLFTNVGGTVIKNYTAAFNTNKPAAEQEDKLRHLDFKTQLLMCIHKTEDGTIRPLITISVPNPVVVGGKKSYLVLNGSVIFKRDQLDTCTDDDIQYDDDLVLNNDEYINLYICGQLRVGDKYFDGYGGWKQNATWFMIPLHSDNKPDEKIHFFNQLYPIENNITYHMNLPVNEGYAILLPEDIITSDDIEFSFIQPVFTAYNTKYTGYLISDFTAEIQVANRQPDVIYESDTEYRNIIGNGYVNDFEGADFKICTYDNKEANYSAVVYNNPNPVYLDKFYNSASDEYVRSEEHFINRIFRQNSKPPFIFEFTTFNNVKPYTLLSSALFGSSKVFIVDEQEIDWRLNTNRLKIVEKK